VANEIELHGREDSGRYPQPVRSLRYVVADVFTDTPLAGNPVAVFTDGRALEADEMQRLGRELNLSETVFVLPAESGGHARIRIFTPSTELPFAGHPTLGAAFVLAQPLQLDEIRLETGMGIVPVALEREGDRIVFGRMEQPLPSWEPFGDEARLLAALRVDRSALPVELYDNGVRHVYVTLGSDEEVAALRPDAVALEDLDVVGVNCFAGDGIRWKTRMFAPAGGVAEDPATGSAAGPLAVHLARHGRIAFGEEIEISQGVEIGRPSTLYARAEGTAEQVDRVQVGGSAVIVARGEFRLPK
jgi:trans-2,3-dihydro-3-hydroxyanthranilate isomerase